MVKIRAFDRLAAEHEVTSAGLALAWLVNHPLVTAPIVGPSKESQWTAVHEAQKLPWTSQLANRLDSLFS